MRRTASAAEHGETADFVEDLADDDPHWWNKAA
jgi:hypothetical protein